MTQSIHQRVAERLNRVALKSAKGSFADEFAAILAEEYGPLIDVILSAYAHVSHGGPTRAEVTELLSKKGLI